MHYPPATVPGPCWRLRRDPVPVQHSCKAENTVRSFPSAVKTRLRHAGDNSSGRAVPSQSTRTHLDAGNYPYWCFCWCRSMPSEGWSCNAAETRPACCSWRTARPACSWRTGADERASYSLPFLYGHSFLPAQNTQMNDERRPRSGGAMISEVGAADIGGYRGYNAGYVQFLFIDLLSCYFSKGTAAV